MNQVDLSQLKDGDFIHVAPSMLLDMDGGNVRLTRTGWDAFVFSIKSQGILQPVIARLMPDQTLQLLAGYGRRDAATPAGLATVPTIIRIVDDATALEIHGRENLDRSELSFASQVSFSRRFMSFYNDAQTAASKLGWSLVMLRERLSLTTCSEDVLIALDEGLITVRHALVLAPFDINVQSNTLKKCVAEKWSLNELKQRADKVQIPLSNAIFELAECKSCPNNTEAQAGLFGMDEGAKCSKSTCYKGKTEARLEVLKQEAEEKYGKVVWLSQSLECDRQTVAASVVGDSQFLSGCASCTDLVVVMNDSLIDNTGSLIENQCTNKSCLNDCIKAFELSKQPPVVKSEDDLITNEVEKSAKPQKEKKVVAANDEHTAHVGSVSSVVVEKHQNEALQASRTHLVGNDTFKLVIHLLGLMSFTGFKAVNSIPQAMGKLMQTSHEQLQKMIAEVEQFAITNAKTFQSTTPAHLALTAAAMSCADGENALIKAWVPTEDTLSSYTTSGLTSICILSGLDKHVEAKEAGAFKKMTSGRKGDVIKAILSQSDFDWSHFAPPAYLDLLEKGRPKSLATAA